MEDWKWLPIHDEFRRVHAPSTLGDDRAYIARSVSAYCQFLALQREITESGEVSSVPALSPVDLVWHSHQLHPQRYFGDCRHNIGFVLFHSPWPLVANHVRGVVTGIEYERGNAGDLLWKKHFGCSIADSFENARA